MFDTHCHLNSLFKEQPASIHSFFTDPSIPNYFLAVSTQRNEWLNLLQFSDNKTYILPALGIHPWFVDDDFQSDLKYLTSLLLHNKVNAIGEIGLDFLPEHISNRLDQIECFTAQLQLAAEFSLPVSLHCLKAHNEMLSLLKNETLTGVMHGFNSSVQVAKQYIDVGFKIGVNGVVVRDNARRYHELVRSVGLDNIVLETDYPNINLPGLVDSHLADINVIADNVACLLDVSVEDVIMQTDYNAKRLFIK